MAQNRPISAPDELPGWAKNVWRAAQRALRAQGTWADTDAPLLRAYVAALVRAREGREAAAAQPFVEGSKGQLVPHPGLKVAAEAERDASTFATKLLLTPETRRKHGISADAGEADPFAQLVG